MADRHKVFISYHHDLDGGYKDSLVRDFGSVFEDWSVRGGDIDESLSTETIRQKIREEWLRDSTVTLVLIGEKTWQRKHVDWEIGSSPRETRTSSRSGLLGILLPSYPATRPGTYNPHTIPPRLADNLDGAHPFATIYSWPSTAGSLQEWIHLAFGRRNQEPPPNNGRLSFGKNRTGHQWSD